MYYGIFVFCAWLIFDGNRLMLETFNIISSSIPTYVVLCKGALGQQRWACMFRDAESSKLLAQHLYNTSLQGLGKKNTLTSLLCQDSIVKLSYILDNLCSYAKDAPQWHEWIFFQPRLYMVSFLLLLRSWAFSWVWLDEGYIIVLCFWRR